MLRLLLLCLLLPSAFGQSGGCYPHSSCVNPGTGTLTTCCVVSNINGNGPGGEKYQCAVSVGHSDEVPTDCQCPEDTCVGGLSPNPYGEGAVETYPKCMAVNGVGWFYNSVNSDNEYFYCTLSVRDWVCQGHGDLADNYRGGEPYLPAAPFNDREVCQCDCGWETSYASDEIECTTSGAPSTSCQSPLTGAFVNFQLVSNPYNSNRQCVDPFGNVQPCFCPIDTCDSYVPAGGSVNFPRCRVFGGVGTVGYAFNTTIANNHAFLFCALLFRGAVCSGH